MQVVEGVEPALIVGVVFLAQLVAAEIGWWFAARAFPDPPERLYGQALALQASVLAIAGLLLAFSFSMAATRFEARRALILAESDAIGTTWLRADALPDAERARARALLVRYVDARLAYARATDDADFEAAVSEAEALQAELWAVVSSAATRASTSVPLGLLTESLNDLMDRHADRLALRAAHVPWVILALLAVSGTVGAGTVGFSFGLARGAHRLAVALVAALVSAILFVILDLDEPRQGRIRVDEASMLRLRESLNGP